MNPIHAPLLAALLLAPFASALADRDDHDHGKHRHSYKEEYWDGHCKVERKFKGNGDYKEERKCKGGPTYYAPVVVQQPVVVPQPVMVAPPVVVAPQPGVVIQGTMRLP